MAGIKMGFNKEQLKGLEPIPGGMYEMLIKSLTLVKTKDGTSRNLKIELEPVSPPVKTADGKPRRIFDTKNEKMANFIQDFVHGCGMPMENGVDIPGEFEPDPQNKEIIGTYRGPLVGRTVKAEVIVSSYNGQPNNKVKQYICKVDGCASKYPEVKHSSNHVKN